MQKLMLCGTLAASIFTLGCSWVVHADGVEKRVAANVFDGKLRLKRGDKYKLSFSTIRYRQSQPPVTIIRQTSGEPIEQAGVFTEEFNADYEVISIDELGNYQIRITYGNRVREDKSWTNGGPNPSRRRYNTALRAKLRELAVGRSFLMKCSPEGQIIEIYELPAIRDQIIREASVILKEVAADPNFKITDTDIKLLDRLMFSSLQGEINTLISEIFSEKYVKEKFGQLSGQFPTRLVSEGEAWNYTISPETALEIEEVQSSRVVLDMNEKVVTIRDSQLIDCGDTAGTNPLTQIFSTKSNATYSGISRIDKATGMLLELTSLRLESGTNTKIDTYTQKEALEQPVKHQTPFSMVTESHIVVQKQ